VYKYGLLRAKQWPEAYPSEWSNWTDAGVAVADMSGFRRINRRSREAALNAKILIGIDHARMTRRKTDVRRLEV
jgi:hypothetical protein